MKRVISATKARNKFFNILNRVLFGNETVYIGKAGADSLVKLEKVSSSRNILASLAGSLPKEDARLMKKAIKEVRTRKARVVKAFN